jgi:hypothetical protein
MVKHARNKKRRAGRIGKTKLKNRNYQFFKPPQITDAVIRDNWDPKKSPKDNLATLGLCSLPNTKVNNRGIISEESSSTNASCKAIELYDIPESDVIPKKTRSQIMLPVSIENQQYMAKCFEKYGDDYAKMSKDIKVNNMQHTENQLKKLGARFLLLTESQLRVDVPETIKHLMVKS